MAGIKGMKRKKGTQPYEKQELEDMCKNYLRDNFHKFSDTNKQKIALTLAAKMVTTKVETTNEHKYQASADDIRETLEEINRIDQNRLN